MHSEDSVLIPESLQTIQVNCILNAFNSPEIEQSLCRIILSFGIRVWNDQERRFWVSLITSKKIAREPALQCKFCMAILPYSGIMERSRTPTYDCYFWRCLKVSVLKNKLNLCVSHKLALSPHRKWGDLFLQWFVH